MHSSRTQRLLAIIATLALLATACGKKAESPSPSREDFAVPGDIPAGADRSGFLLNRGLRFLAEGQNDEAAKVLELARRADPSSPRIALELGRAYMLGKKYDGAEKIFREIADSSSLPADQRTRGRELLVQLLLDRGDLDGAETACAPLLQAGTVSSATHRLSGMIAYQKGDPDSLKRAVSELTEAVRLAPDDAEARTSLGLALLKVNDLPGAASALEEAARLDPDSESAMSNLARVYELQGRSADAETARKRFQEIYDMKSVRQKVGPLRAKGVDAFNAGDLEGALRSFQEILKVSPKDPQALAHIGSVYLAMQRLDEAEAALRQALELRPEDEFALTEMARVRALRNDLPGAIDLLQRAAKSNPDAPEPHYFLAGIFFELRRKDDFLREKAAFERLRKNTPMPGVMELPEAPPQ